MYNRYERKSKEYWKKHKGKHYTNPLLQTKEWSRLREEIYIETGGLCSHCGTLTIPGNKYLNFNLDHRSPVNHKTATREQIFDRSNIQLLCVSCHLHKTLDDKATKQKQVYYVDEETGNISTTPPQTTKEFYRERKISHTRELIDAGKIKI